MFFQFQKRSVLAPGFAGKMIYGFHWCIFRRMTASSIALFLLATRWPASSIDWSVSWLASGRYLGVGGQRGLAAFDPYQVRYHIRTSARVRRLKPAYCADVSAVPEAYRTGHHAAGHAKHHPLRHGDFDAGRMAVYSEPFRRGGLTRCRKSSVWRLGNRRANGDTLIAAALRVTIAKDVARQFLCP